MSKSLLAIALDEKIEKAEREYHRVEKQRREVGIVLCALVELRSIAKGATVSKKTKIKKDGDSNG